MKHCPYCYTDYPRTETKCPSCQAADYENRCAKCGKKINGSHSHCPDCSEKERENAELATRVALGEQEYKKNQEILAASRVGTPTGSCLPLLHSWRGCICVRCGKENENEECDLLGCTCKICGKNHDSDHSYFPVSVGGNLERCVICGKTRDIKAEAEKAKRNRLFLTVALLVLFPPVGIILTWLFQNEWKPETKKKISIASGIWFIIAIIAIVISSGVLTGISIRTPAVPEGYAMVPAASGSFSRRDYQDVVADFEAAGFTNITAEGLGDLITGWLVRDGSVSQVSVDGVTTFSANRVFRANARVIITHHSFP